jgi:hypothetical protein
LRETGATRLAGAFAWNFGALFASFGQTNRNGLLAAFYRSAFAALSGSQRALFSAAHGALDGFLCRSSQIVVNRYWMKLVPAGTYGKLRSSE